MLKQHKVGVAVTAAALALGALTAAVAVNGFSGDNVHPQPHLPSEATPPHFNPWIDPQTGRFTVRDFDDRELSVEVKRQYPVTDPRWGPFAECMNTAGYSVGDPKGFSRATLDDILGRLNVTTNLQENRLLDAGATLPGMPGAFLKCADTWLSIPVSDFPKHGFTIVFPTIPVGK